MRFSTSEPVSGPVFNSRVRTFRLDDLAGRARTRVATFTDGSRTLLALINGT